MAVISYYKFQSQIVKLCIPANITLRACQTILLRGGGGGGGHVFYESIFSAQPIKLSYNWTIYFMTLRNIYYGLEFLMLISYSKSTLYIISWKI